MNLEQYRIHKKIEITPPIVCVVSKRKSHKPKVGESEYYDIKVKLYRSSGLAWDKTIVFLAEAENGEKFSINENQIK